MQQIINFEIKVKNGDETKIAEIIKEVVPSYKFFRFISEELTQRRVNDWVSDTVSLPQIVKNFSDEQMFEFDFDTLFPDLFEDIAVRYPEAVFRGHAEYYNGNYGVMNDCDVIYDGKNLMVL